MNAYQAHTIVTRLPTVSTAMGHFLVCVKLVILETERIAEVSRKFHALRIPKDVMEIWEQLSGK